MNLLSISRFELIKLLGTKRGWISIAAFILVWLVVLCYVIEPAARLVHKAGYKKSQAHTGAVTLIQRFGGALNLNIHYHMLFLDGVYVESANGSTRFQSGTGVPIHCPPRRFRESPVTDRKRAGAI